MRICTVLHCLHFCAPRLRSSFLVIVELLFRFHKNRSPYQCQSACNRTCLERSTLDIPRRANTRPRADVAMYIRGHCSVCRFQLLNFFMFPPSHPCLWATRAHLQVWLFSVQWVPSTLLRTSDQWLPLRVESGMARGASRSPSLCDVSRTEHSTCDIGLGAHFTCSITDVTTPRMCSRPILERGGNGETAHLYELQVRAAKWMELTAQREFVGTSRNCPMYTQFIDVAEGRQQVGVGAGDSMIGKRQI